MAQLPGLVVTVCSARHTYLSINSRVHNHYCYCYWCWTHITVIGPLSPILRYCYRYYFNCFQNGFRSLLSIWRVYWKILCYCYRNHCNRFEMVFDSYYLNSTCIFALKPLKYTFMKYFEIFPPKIPLKIYIYIMTCNLFWKNTYGFW